MPEAFCDWEAPPPSPPRREGEWSPRFPYRVDVGFVLSLISIYNSFNVLWILYAGGVLCVRNVRKKVLLNLWVLWEKEISFVREKPHQRVVCVSSHRVGAFYFSQSNTEEQNTQKPTETLSQPISQNVTATFSSNAPWTLYAGGVLWTRNCAQKCSVNSVRSVRDKTPQRVVCVSSHRVGAFYFSQIYTEEQNTQKSTETLSQPVSQSVTANVSWKASVNSVCRRPSVGSKCAPKCSVNSVRSVRDKTPHCEYPTIFLSQKITEEQNTQTFTETLSQPISQSVTANVGWKASVTSVCRRCSVSSKQYAKMFC